MTRNIQLVNAYSLGDILRMIEATKREIALRKRVYPNLVKKGRMSERESEEEIEIFEKVLALLKDHEQVISPQQNLF